jgi:hypothetical protein
VVNRVVVNVRVGFAKTPLRYFHHPIQKHQEHFAWRNDDLLSMLLGENAKGDSSVTVSCLLAITLQPAPNASRLLTYIWNEPASKRKKRPRYLAVASPLRGGSLK